MTLPAPHAARDPVWKLVLAGVLLAVGLGVAAYRLLGPGLASLPVLMPDSTDQALAAVPAPGVLPAAAVVSSPREEAERALFRDVVATRRADVLVLPFAAPTAMGLDRTARSLMAQRLAAAIAARSDLAVADVGLVTRALGSKRRVYAEAEVADLARRLGAKLVIAAEVRREPAEPTTKRHAGGPQRFALRVTLSGPLAGEQARVLEWADAAFSDVLPPEERFRPMMEGLLAELPVQLRPEAPPQAAALGATLPQRGLDLAAGESGSALDDAIRLQLVALLHPGRELYSDLLWQRSLVALDRVAPGSPAAALARARANFHLGRRPYAVALLGDEPGAAETALREALQGNLPESERAAAGIADPVLKVLASIELEDLRSEYGRSAGRSERRDAFLAAAPALATVAQLRLARDDWFNPEVSDRVADELESLGVAVERPWTVGRVLRYLAERATGIPIGDLFPETTQAAAVEKTHAPLWRARASDWAPIGLGPRVVPADWFELLYAANRAAAYKTAYSIHFRQARPQAALDAVRELADGFPVDAAMANLEAAAIGTLAGDHNIESRDSPQWEPASRLARDAYLWEGGESDQSVWAEQLLWKKAYVKVVDEPPHPQRHWPDPHANRFTLTKAIPRDELERQAAWNIRRVAYVQTQFGAVEAAIKGLRALGRDAEAEPFLGEAKARFNGSAERQRFLLASARHEAGPAGEEQAQRAALTANPGDYGAYSRLARFLIRERRPAEAQQVLLSYPRFADASGDRLSVGNDAWKGAWALLASGETELSRPLYEIAYGIETGSGAWMLAGETLAYFDRDWERAAAFAAQRRDRYEDPHGANEHVAFLMLAGRPDAAWKSYQSASRKLESAQPQWGAVFGHRVQGSTDREIFEFANAWSLAAKRQDLEGNLRDHLAFMALYLDRQASDEAMALLKQLNSRHGDQSYLHIAAGYNAFQRRDYPALIRDWGVLNANLANVSARFGESLSYPLPYMALAHGATGRLDAFSPALAQYGARFPDGFEHVLARAVIAAFEGRHDEAEQRFWHAFLDRPDTGTRPIYSGLMVLELLEAVYEQTGEDRYRAQLVDLARRLQRAWPDAFTFAYEAKHTTVPEDRVRALGTALHLDRRSAHIAHFSAGEKANAQAWFARHDGLRSGAPERSPQTAGRK